MTDLVEPKVQGEPGGPVVETPTTPAAGGVPQGTPTQTPVDAEATLKAKYEAEVAKYQADLNKMKSTFQSQDAKRQQEWQQRQQKYEQEIERLRVATMDDEQRKAYEAERKSDEYRQMQETIAELSRKQEETEAMFNAQQYFLEQGVPPTVLVINDGYENLWNSGMNWIMDEFKRLQTAKTAPAPVGPKVPPPAPPVDTGTGTPTVGTTWADLEKIYGSREAVYQAIESRRLSPDILPK